MPEILLPFGQPEFSPGEKERVRYLLELEREDLTSPDLIGYHGLSLEVLDHLIKYEKLPGASEGVMMKLGSVYFYPKFSVLPHVYKQWYLNPAEDQAYMLNSANYARNIAQHHALSALLGFSINDPRTVDFIPLSPWTAMDEKLLVQPPQTPDERNYYSELHESVRELEVTVKQFLSACKAAINRKGLVVGLNRSLLDRYKPQKGDDFILGNMLLASRARGDLFIEVPSGLDYRDLVGLRPMGSEEKSYMEQLKSKL